MLARLRPLVVIAALACGHSEPRVAEPMQMATRVEVSSTAPAPEPELETEEPPPPPPIDPRSLRRDGELLAIPGPRGFLSSWQRWASGREPLDEAAEVSLARPCIDGGACPAPTTFSQDHWRIELGDVAAGDERIAYLGIRLRAARASQLNLLIGIRGAVAVRLDGRLVAEGASEDRFRKDLVLATLDLDAGDHQLLIRASRPERGRWRASVRVLDARLRPGAGEVAMILGALDEARVRQLAAGAARLDESRVLGGDGAPKARLRISFPGGGPWRTIGARLGEQARELGTEGPTFDDALRLELPLAALAPGGALAAGAGERSFPIGERLASDRRVLEAASSLRASLAHASEASRGPIAWRAREAERVVREGDGDPRWRQWLAGEARRIAAAIARGRDPFARIRGYERMGFVSRLDGTAQHYELFVPPGYSDARAWPLLVTLHGFKGNAGDYFRNTFGLARDAENGESLVDHGRHGAPPTTGPMIVIGPEGRGQTYYRQAGETDVLEAIADAQSRFRIDPSRIYVTGGSMGGTGAAYLPYRHPDMFAAAAALAGYHDQRVRVDTDHAALSPVERFLEAERSDVDWAENGLHLPMLLVRGTRDRPLEWTRSLVRRLDALGYRHEHREPELGHNVWTETYAQGAIFQWLGAHRRPASPEHVRLRSARDRTRQAYWVRLDAREAPDRFAHIDATCRRGVATLSTEGVRALTLSPPATFLAEGAPLRVVIDGAELTGEPPLHLSRTQGEWRVAPQAVEVRASAPIRDVFHEPLVFVVGTQDPDHTAINRLVAEHWAHPKGWDVEYPIVDDVALDERATEGAVLVLIGPPSSNAVLARIQDRLPIRFDRDAIMHAGARHEGREVGTAFVAPHPDHPAQSVLVIAGPHPLGTWRSTFLPDILPAYVIYDERVAPARDRWACGGTGCEYRAHGFFE